jgi:hypothetical protein
MATASGVTIWPQPPSTDSAWQVKPLAMLSTGGRAERVNVREVRLWGKPVLINESNEVYCLCGRFVDVEELGQPQNTHPVGLVRLRSGQLFPSIEDHTLETKNEAGF